MQNKYHARKVMTPDGILHDSGKEAGRWQELKLMERVGMISDLQRQIRYDLIPKQPGERACYYVADFVYRDKNTGEIVVEDVKSDATRTPEYIIKRKLMLYMHGIRIREI